MNLESARLDTVATGLLKHNPDARFSRLYFCHSLNRLQRGLSAIAELLVMIGNPLLCVLRLSERKLSEFYCRAAMNAGRFSHDKAVCPSVHLSVCLSVKRTIYHKTK